MAALGFLGQTIDSLDGSAAAIQAGQVQAGADQQAATASTNAANNSLAQQYQMYLTGQAAQAPYLQSGQEAQAALNSALGLGQTTASAAPGAVTLANGQVVTPANNNASQAELNAAAGSVTPGTLTQQFNNADLNAQLAPNYEFQLQQGQEALQNTLASQGLLGSGQGAKELEDYTQNYAGNAYQSAFNNYQQQQTNLYNRLNGVASTGEQAAGQTAQLSTATGQNLGATTVSGTQNANAATTAGAAATAGGLVGSANAGMNLVQQGVNAALTYATGGAYAAALAAANAAKSGSSSSQQQQFYGLGTNPAGNQQQQQIYGSGTNAAVNNIAPY